MAAGNTIVLKPSEDTPYAGGLFFAEVLEEAGIPKGVFNVITCSRDRVQEMGDEMIENPLVKGISFTGSNPWAARSRPRLARISKNAAWNLAARTA